MSCLPSIPAQLSNPVLDQRAVQDIQNLFIDELDWLELCYPIARIGVTKTENNESYKYPQVYSGSGAEYYDVRPDKAVSSYCFFEVNESIPVDTDEDLTRYNLSAIFWFNLPMLDGSKVYDFSRELAGHVLRIMEESLYSGKFSNIVAEFRPEEIFDKYSMSQEDTQMLMYPYGAFKITFDYEQLDEAGCFDVFVTGTSGCE